MSHGPKFLNLESVPTLTGMWIFLRKNSTALTSKGLFKCSLIKGSLSNKIAWRFAIQENHTGTGGEKGLRKRNRVKLDLKLNVKAEMGLKPGMSEASSKQNKFQSQS